jgi:hypothetical protein
MYYKGEIGDGREVGRWKKDMRNIVHYRKMIASSKVEI